MTTTNEISTQTDLNALAAAWWMTGVAAAFRMRGFPRIIIRDLFEQHLAVAEEIIGGGTFRGPLAIYALIDYVADLSIVVSPQIKFPD